MVFRRWAYRIAMTPAFLFMWSSRALYYLGFEGGIHAVFFLLRFFFLAYFVAPSMIAVLARVILSHRVDFFVPYGPCRRQDFDVVFPPAKLQVRGCVICFAGGAWTLSHKSFSAPLVLELVASGLIVVCVDIRQFPQATAEMQSADVCASISAVRSRLDNWGCDPRRLYVIGHSAGAHLLALSLLKSLATAQNENPVSLGIRRSFLVSGPYDILSLRPFVQSRGLPSPFLDALFLNDDVRFSPTLLAEQLIKSQPSPIPKTPQKAPRSKMLNNHHHHHSRTGSLSNSLFRASSDLFLWAGRAMDEEEADLFPPASSLPTSLLDTVDTDTDIASPPRLSRVSLRHKHALSKLGSLHLWHGESDITIPPIQAINFAAALRGTGVTATLNLVQFGTHTSLVLEDPLLGVKTGLLAAVLDAIDLDDASDHGDHSLTLELKQTRSNPKAHLSNWWGILVRAANPF